MKALRIGTAAVAAAMALAHAPAASQSAPTTNTPANEPAGAPVIGDFTLNGTVTRREAPPPAQEAPPSRPDATGGTEPSSPNPVPLTPSEQAPGGSLSQSATVNLPEPNVADAQRTSPEQVSDFTSQPSLSPTIVPPEASAAVAESGSLWPWLLAALLVAGAIGYYAWRQRARASLARSAAAIETFIPNEPVPEAQPRVPQPVRSKHNAASSPGLVASRLRPSLELEVIPGRCVIDELKATVEFRVAVFNWGSAPARDVLVEACLFNAGPAQDQEIGAFFEHPVAKGQRIEVIPPLKPVTLNSAVTLTREQMRIFEVAGRRLFVPMLAFNALYRWSGGDAQTSVSYLIGRDTKGEKLAPFRTDLGPRTFRDVALREHHLSLRK